MVSFDILWTMNAVYHVMSNIIEVKNLIKKYNSYTAVDSISFNVKQGEFFGILGPNGAGKTTTIRMIYGFSPITQGSLRVFGLDITTDWREIKHRIGVCQQDNTLDPDLTVEKNLRVFANYFSIPSDQAKQRAEELLNFFSLNHKRNSKVVELSGGMARRLVLARSLINQPDLLILDEPTTGLDPQSRHLLWERLDRLKEQGLTVLITTHYMEEASVLCDRLVIVDKGQILVQGSPSDLIAKYAGNQVVEIEGHDPALYQFVIQNEIAHDNLGERLILYIPEDRPLLSEEIRKKFCMEKCIYRNSTLEDVFLRLTGRELRE